MKRRTCINVNESQADGSHQSDSAESDYSGDETSSSQATTSKTSTATKIKKYDLKFQNSWLSDVLFKDWLEKRGEFAYCKFCDCKLCCTRTALKRHKDNKKHKDIWLVKEQACSPITSLLGSQAKAARMEIKLCSFIAEKNLPISIVEDLLPLLKDLFPSDEPLRQVTLGKQKSTNVIRQVLGFIQYRSVWPS